MLGNIHKRRHSPLNIHSGDGGDTRIRSLWPKRKWEDATYAIQFLLDARENPALINQYSKAGGGVCFEGQPGDPADFPNVFNNYMPSDLAWTESFIARFPFSANAGRLRMLVGTDLTVAPHPLYYTYTGLNASGAFYKPYEAKPVNGSNVSVISGDNQAGLANQPLSDLLTALVTDNSGNPLHGGPG